MPSWQRRGWRSVALEVGGKGQKRIARHLASPSLGHYASLSFVVIGEGPENFGLRIATQLIAAALRPIRQAKSMQAQGGESRSHSNNK